MIRVAYSAWRREGSPVSRISSGVGTLRMRHRKSSRNMENFFCRANSRSRRFLHRIWVKKRTGERVQRADESMTSRITQEIRSWTPVCEMGWLLRDFAARRFFTYKLDAVLKEVFKWYKNRVIKYAKGRRKMFLGLLCHRMFATFEHFSCDSAHLCAAFYSSLD